ncbi:MAG: SPOR domain-containing protein [Blastocatellia bacterium]|nr:SPOR domain-containing protein [Blastocatellia bacterium]
MKKSAISLVFSLLALFAITVVAAAQSIRYTVQLEATQALDLALEKLKGFKGQGLDAYIVKTEVQGKGTFYRIRVGNFPTKADASKYGAELRRLGFSSDFFIATYEPPSDLNDSAPTRGVAPTKNQPAKEPTKEAPKPAQPVAPPARQQARPVAEAQPAPAPPPASAPAVTEQPKPAAPLATPPDQKLAANIANPITPPASAAPAAAAPAPAPAAAPANAAALNFVKFKDQSIGYSFDHPQTWEGGQLDSKDAQDQKVSAGALFKSYQDSAFITAIWNSLEKANSPEQDNDLIVQLILQSMGSDAGTQQMTETSRKVVNEGGTIKTYLDLKATFKSQGQEGPLDFLGKAVIARTGKGILLVVAFYWKGGPPYVSGIADKIIASVQPPA